MIGSSPFWWARGDCIANFPVGGRDLGLWSSVCATSRVLPSLSAGRSLMMGQVLAEGHRLVGLPLHAVFHLLICNGEVIRIQLSRDPFTVGPLYLGLWRTSRCRCW